MDPLTIIAMTNAALALVETAVPQIKRMFESGEITLAQQQELLTRINGLRDQMGKSFTGPEWELSTKPPAV